MHAHRHSSRVYIHVRPQAKILERRLRREVAPVMRCRGPDAPQVRCGLMRCTSKQIDALHNGSACSRDIHCSQYYRTTFANWTFCIIVGNRRTPRLAQRPGRPWRICEANASEVLEACASGRTSALLPEVSWNDATTRVS